MQGKHVIAGAAAVLMLAAATVFAQVKNRASGEQENTFVSPGDQAVVALDRSHLEGNEVIRLEVILTAERIERDPAVGIRVDALCDGGCGADFQGVRSVELANVGLFPSLVEGETRTIELLLAAEELPDAATHLEIQMQSLTEGQSIKDALLSLEAVSLR